MRGKRASEGSGRVPLMALAAALVQGGGWAGAMADGARAAFPGRNGRVHNTKRLHSGPRYLPPAEFEAAERLGG